MSDLMRDAALAYAAKGKPVFPCTCEKKPISILSGTEVPRDGSGEQSHADLNGGESGRRLLAVVTDRRPWQLC